LVQGLPQEGARYPRRGVPVSPDKERAGTIPNRGDDAFDPANPARGIETLTLRTRRITKPLYPEPGVLDPPEREIEAADYCAMLDGTELGGADPYRHPRLFLYQNVSFEPSPGGTRLPPPDFDTALTTLAFLFAFPTSSITEPLSDDEVLPQPDKEFQVASSADGSASVITPPRRSTASQKAEAARPDRRSPAGASGWRLVLGGLGGFAMIAASLLRWRSRGR
jgi:hypothetical protein